MIKYAEIKGYRNLGEVATFTHIYQLIEKNKKIPMVILICVYDKKPSKIFKGYLYKLTKTFVNVDLKENEIEEIKKHVGKIKQVNFNEFIKNTMFKNTYPGYKEEKINDMKGEINE